MITIYGSTPSKKNSKIMVCRGRTPILLPSAKYQEWHKEAIKSLHGQKPIPPGYLKVTFYAKDNRKFDLSNKFESIADLLVDAGLLEDDNYSILPEVLLKFGGVDKDNPRAEIEW